jgi:hypothetical protein
MDSLLRQLQHETVGLATRRHFLRDCTTGLGAMFLSAMGGSALAAAPGNRFVRPQAEPMSTLAPDFPAKAKRVIFLHMAGAPSQLELFDYKPELDKLNGQPCPPSFLEGKRFAFISGVPKMLGPQYPFHKAGKSGAWISDRLPHFEKVIDDVCFIKSMKTDQFNHAPAQLLVQTGTPLLGGASIGSWVLYGLGSENQNLPGFVVLVSGGNTPDGGKSLWGSGFLPSVYQGVQCRSQGDPVLYLSNPPGVSRDLRRRALDSLGRINRRAYEEAGDPETLTRVAQHEMAFRMQMNATDAMDLGQEPSHIHELYGTKPGNESFANNCLLARRLAERGVRFIQLYHWGWDSHGAGANEALNAGFRDRCQEVDRPIAALLTDLKQRGLLDETLVVWGGEFGRTPMQENRGGGQMAFIGRDHNPGAFTIWMAGGGVKSGFSYGGTDPIGYDAVENPVEIRDLHATMLKLMGFDHHKLTYPFQGLNQKLTGVKPVRVVDEIIA